MLGYIKLMAAFVMLAGVGVLTCRVIARLSNSPGASRALVRIAGAMIGSVAGVFAFQVLALAALVLMFGVFWCLQQMLGRLEGGAQIIWNLTVIASMLGLFIAATVVGFIVGWGVGARVAAGTSVRRSLQGSRVLSIFIHRISVVR